MKKIIDRLINDAIQGIDVYHHNGSFWLIFTDKKEWVIELKKNGKLWYRYQFFNNLFKYVSMDVVKNQHYITEWVEDTIRNGAKTTGADLLNKSSFVEDTIRNGVKTTRMLKLNSSGSVEDTIRNGVKTTNGNEKVRPLLVEDAIKNGVIMN